MILNLAVLELTHIFLIGLNPPRPQSSGFNPPWPQSPRPQSPWPQSTWPQSAWNHLFSKEDICTVYWSQKQKNHNCPSNIHLVVLWPALQRTRLPEDRSRFGDWGDKIVRPPPPTCWPGTGSREVLAGVRIMLQAKVFSPGPDVPSKRTSKTIMVAFQARPNDKWYKLSCCIPDWRTK